MNSLANDRFLGKQTKPSSTSKPSQKPSKPSSKPSATYKSSPSATYIAPVASASASGSAKVKREAEEKRSKIQELIENGNWKVLDDRVLCPAGMTACPIFPRMASYECE